MTNLWCLLETANFKTLFGNNTKGNAIVAKILEFKFRHHQKKNGGYKNTPLCLPYAVGQSFPKEKVVPKITAKGRTPETYRLKGEMLPQ